MDLLEFKILKGKEISDKLFKNFYNLLESSFPHIEYRSFENQKALLAKEIYHILFCFKDEIMIGAMAFWHIDGYVFIEHFAVNKAFRGHKIGTKMLEKIKNNTEGFVILEIELPYNEISRKRIDFYKRNGFYYNDFEYYQTPLNKGDKPLPLRIMSYPDYLEKTEFSKIQKALVKAVYNS